MSGDQSNPAQSSITSKEVKAFASGYLELILPKGFDGHFFLSGGCYKTLLHGKPPNDLDLWPASLQDRERLMTALLNQGAELEAHTMFNSRFSVAGIRVEVTTKCKPTLEESVAEFDIILSCIGAEYLNGRVIDAYVHPEVLDCVRAKEVRVVRRLTSMRYTLGSLARVRRYATELGYAIQEASIRRIWYVYAAASVEERSKMLEANGLTLDEVPAWARIVREFVLGRPPEKCRPFLDHELDQVRTRLLAVPPACEGTKPLAVFVAGLPASGKSHALEDMLRSLNLPPVENFANIDMDFLRSFHSQFVGFLKGESKKSHVEVAIFADLISWFNEGSDAERMLYQEPNSVVKELLRKRRSFVLPVHTVGSVDFMQAVTCKHGYQPILLEVRAPIEVAIERALERARATGRFAAPEYVRESAKDLDEFLVHARGFMQKQEDGIMAVFDNSRNGGGGIPLPRIG